MNNLSPSDLSILLVEPSDMQRKLIVKSLKQENITQIQEATSLAEAKELIVSRTPDLVASSMYFADGDAKELVKFIKGNDEYNDVAFMLVSSECRKAQLEEFKQSGTVAILPKPFASEHLGKALNATIDLLSYEELELELFDVQQVRCLLVDDSKLARNHIKRVLGNLGIDKVTEAEDGQQAIEIIKESMFDLVVTDYNMPEVDGEQLTQYIRNESQQSHIPILMVTSEANDTHLSNVEQSGVNALCDKPFEPKNVKELLYRLLE